jgi:diadenylate cyclase
MRALVNPMTDYPSNYGWLIDLVDIGLVAFVIYRIILLLRGTLAHRIIIGLAILIICNLLSRFAGFQTFNLILSNFLGSVIIVLAIIFQHDIRRAFFAFSRNRPDEESREDVQSVIEELAGAAESLANKKIGGLVVIEQSMAINHFLVIGTEIDAKVTSELITSIFLPYSPIHDGAVIVQRGKLTKAGCFLPLTQNPEISKAMGTRHRAAIGLTELVDAVVIVVSEETGRISLAVGGLIKRVLDPNDLRISLKRLLDPRWMR